MRMDFPADMRDRVTEYVAKGQLHVNHGRTAGVITRFGCTYAATEHELTAARKLFDNGAIVLEFAGVEHEGVFYHDVIAKGE